MPDNAQDIAKIKEDVAFIRGVLHNFEATEGRISSLETTARTQNIVGTVVAMALACFAWIKDG